MAKVNPGFVFDETWVPAARRLTNEELGEAMKTLFVRVFEHGIGETSNEKVDMFLAMVIPQINDRREKYYERCEKNRANSLKRKNIKKTPASNQNIDINAYDDPDWGDNG